MPPASTNRPVRSRVRVAVSPLMLYRTLSLAACLVLLSAHVSQAESPIRQLTNTSASNLRPDWSPDGRQIAFQSNRNGLYQIYIMDADGGNERLLSPSNVDDRHPAWSPDGRFIAVDSGTSMEREIWLIEVASGARTQLTRLGAVASFPSWSADGSQLSFYVYRNGAMDLWAVARDGSGLRQLTRDLASERNQQCTFACHAAAWSPDGSRIALADGDNSRVLLIRATDGSGMVQISPDGERSHFPIYLPDGRIVYVSEHVSQEQSWTDLWAVRPGSPADRTEVARGIQAQGPFELSPDGQQLLFSSPRSGNFEIYAVTLDDEGKAALAARPERARPATEPETLPPGSLPPAITAVDAGEETSQGVRLPTSATPYLAALGVLALLTLGVEVGLRLRRRHRGG